MTCDTSRRRICTFRPQSGCRDAGWGSTGCRKRGAYSHAQRCSTCRRTNAGCQCACTDVSAVAGGSWEPCRRRPAWWAARQSAKKEPMVSGSSCCCWCCPWSMKGGSNWYFLWLRLNNKSCPSWCSTVGSCWGSRLEGSSRR